MNKVMLDCVRSLLETLEDNALTLDVSATNIIRTYAPVCTLDTLPTGEPWLVVFLQNCVVNEEEELKASVGKTLTVRVGLVQKVEFIDTEELDPFLEHVETLQNFFLGFKSWSSSTASYYVTKATIDQAVDDSALADANIALGCFDLEIQTFVNYD